MKDVSKLSREELINIVRSYDDSVKFVPHNKVSVVDVEVESNMESLDKCKKIADDLIKTNHQFITNRKNKMRDESFGYIQ